jgi:4-amino-4-deoxy-L-arabinose transferase-like glycosyltransferase
MAVMRAGGLVLAGMGPLGWLIILNNHAAQPPSLTVQLLLLVGGVTLFTVGVGGVGSSVGTMPALPGEQGKRTSGRGMPRPYEREWLLVGGLTLLALIVRVWGAGETIHLFVDELNFVEGVNAVRRGGDLYLLHRFDWVAAFPYVFPVLQNFGVEFVGNTLGGLRLFSAVCGALTVPAVYLLARALTGNPAVPLIAAALLATFPPHLQFSRLALINIVDPLPGTLALACLAHGVNNQRRLTFATAGALLGMTQYFYEGGRLLYPALIGLWLLVLLLRRRVRLVDAGALLLTFGAAALPFYATMTAQGYSFFPRLGAKGFDDSYWAGLLTGSASDLAAHLGHIMGTFGVYSFIPDASFYYGGHFPLILPLLAPFFLVGIVVSLWRGAWVLPLTLVGASLGSSLLTTGAWASSLVLTFPVLTLLTAWGLAAALDGLRRLISRGDLQDAQGRRGIHGDDNERGVHIDNNGRGVHGDDNGRGVHIDNNGRGKPRPSTLAVSRKPLSGRQRFLYG